MHILHLDFERPEGGPCGYCLLIVIDQFHSPEQFYRKLLFPIADKWVNT